jgi:hypothetical protein
MEAYRLYPLHLAVEEADIDTSASYTDTGIVSVCQVFSINDTMF